MRSTRVIVLNLTVQFRYFVVNALGLKNINSDGTCVDDVGDINWE